MCKCALFLSQDFIGAVHLWAVNGHFHNDDGGSGHNGGPAKSQMGLAGIVMCDLCLLCVSWKEGNR